MTIAAHQLILYELLILNEVRIASRSHELNFMIWVRKTCGRKDKSIILSDILSEKQIKTLCYACKDNRRITGKCKTKSEIETETETATQSQNLTEQN